MDVINNIKLKLEFFSSKDKNVALILQSKCEHGGCHLASNNTRLQLKPFIVYLKAHKAMQEYFF